MKPLKQFEILISEEISYKYLVYAMDKEEAQNKAMTIHEEGNTDCAIVSVDRCEIINCREVN